MNKGINTIIYPVGDLQKTKTSLLYLFGIEPHTDNPYFIGFHTWDQDKGPDTHKHGMSAYYDADDIFTVKQPLSDSRAVLIQEIKMSVVVN